MFIVTAHPRIRSSSIGAAWAAPDATMPPRWGLRRFCLDSCTQWVQGSGIALATAYGNVSSFEPHQKIAKNVANTAVTPIATSPQA